MLKSGIMAVASCVVMWTSSPLNVYAVLGLDMPDGEDTVAAVTDDLVLVAASFYFAG